MKRTLQFSSFKPKYSFSSFLSDYVKAEWNTIHPNIIYHLFLGNEASDADSIISAATYSYLSYLQASRDLFGDNVQDNMNSRFIPLVAVSRDDYELRRETAVLLDYVDIKLSDIPSFEDFISVISECKSSEVRGKLSIKLTLLDHNVMSEKVLGHMSSGLFRHFEICEIVDHHQDMGRYLDSCPMGSPNRNIAFDDVSLAASAASTCTLIHESIRSRAFLSLEVLDIEVLLLGVILIDSLNMDPEVNKGTHRDEKALAEICRDLFATSEMEPLEVRKLIFSELVSCKTDEKFWGNMSIANALKFDYKLFTEKNGVRIGYSSILLSPELLFRGDFATVANYMDSQNLDLLVVLSFHRMKKEMVLVQRRNYLEADFLDNLAAHLLHLNDLQLEEYNLFEIEDTSLTEADSLHSLKIRVFKQLNLVASRKQIAPIISHFCCQS